MGMAGLAGAVGVAVIIAYALPSSHREQHVTTNSLPATPTPAVTATQLAAGHWAVLPPAPIPTRDNPVVVWTGREIIVWGGESGPQGNVVHADGAAYDPSTNQWTVLPAAPISGRSGAAAVWTGTEMLIWGGYDESGPGFHVSATGAAYDPGTNSWRMLPPASLSARAGAQAVWTGNAALILGGGPAVIQSQSGYATNAALYHPGSNTWTTVSPPPTPAGHDLDWVLAAQAGDRTLAWSTWYTTTPTGQNSTTTTAGVDFYSYSERTGQWERIVHSNPTVVDPSQAIWTGQTVLVGGASGYCGVCPGPMTAEVSAFYDPATETWTPIPPDPIAFAQPKLAWTGAAVISVDLAADIGSGPGSTNPGNATAFDPGRQRWFNLPVPPAACPAYSTPIWTGQQMIAICAQPGTETAATAGGLALTPGP